jgi:hypothetical protein
MTACTQAECTGTIIDGYCDVCGSPAGAPTLVHTGAAAEAASHAPSEPGLTAFGQVSGFPSRLRNAHPTTACTQPGCAGTIVDGYCDVCGSPASAAPFVPAQAAASAASPASAEPDQTAVHRESGFPAEPKNAGIMTACTQPWCTGTIVDGYCDVCGSPATADPFVSAAAAASVTSPAPADEPGLTAVPASTPAPAPVDEEIPTIFDLPWITKTTDSIDIQGSREVEATLRRLIEPAAADLESDTAEVEPVAADLEEGDTAEVEPVAADLEEGDTAEVEPVAADLEEGDTAEVEPVAADLDKDDTAPAGPQHDDTVKMPAVPAVLSGGRHQRPQLPEQPVLGPVQTPAKKRRLGYLALAATALAALLIGALLFAASRDRDVTVQPVPTVTATATAMVTKPTNAPSNQSTDIGGKEPTIQLEDLPDSARPFQPVRIQGRYHGGANTFLRVQRWEEGKWLAFPVPTKTNQSGRFTTYVEFGQPGRYQLRLLDPGSGVTSKPFVLVIKG